MTETPSQSEVPLQNVELPNGRHGYDAAQVARGTTDNGEQWNLTIRNQNDGYSSSREYNLVIGSHVAIVHVSAQGAVSNVSNERGRITHPINSPAVNQAGNAQGERLLAILNEAIASGGISVDELNRLRNPTESISDMTAVEGRAGQTRSGARVSQPRGGGGPSL